MLTIAVALTLVGFGLLVFALVTSNFALAIACIVVCVVGLAVLLVDTLRANKRGGSGADDEPLFTIRNRESTERSQPLADEDAEAEQQVPETHAAADDALSWEPATAETAAAPVASGLGSIVSPDAHGSPVEETRQFDTAGRPLDTAAQAQPEYPQYSTGQQPAYDTGRQPVQTETGDANDYIRSVTGQFPAQSPTGRIPAVQTYEENPQPVETSDPITGGQPQINTDSGYVGRRRRVEGEDDSVVVNTPDPTLPAMKLVYGDETESTDPRRDG